MSSFNPAESTPVTPARPAADAVRVIELLRPAVVLFAIFSIATGLLYPFAVTGVARLAMPDAASGSLVERDGVVVGSRLIGQSFSEPKHLWGRPSATAPMPANASASAGSNLGPMNPALLEAVQARADALRAADPLKRATVPIELVTTSASGLDPHLSPAAADWQVPRIAAARGLTQDAVRATIARHTEQPVLPFLGEPVVNVLGVNLELDAAPR
jgi:potassium-transporting ATPase KdpC subunit